MHRALFGEREGSASVRVVATVNLLLVHRYFWPDTPAYAAMLRHLGESWVQHGHVVSVFSTQPSYKREVVMTPRPRLENLAGMTITRTPLPFRGDWSPPRRLINTALFLLQLLIHMARHRDVDVVVMSTVPQIVGARVASLAAGLLGKRFVYHMQDIHPEGMRAAGFVREGMAYRVLRRLDTATCRSAAAVVVLSADMRRTILARDSSLARKVHVIRNPAVRGFEDADTDVPAALRKATGRFRAVFAGNIGRFQGLETVVEAATGLRDEGIEVALVGDGAAKSALMAKAEASGSSAMRFLPHQNVSVADSLIAEADVALITLAPGVAFTAFPSKLINYTRSATALLVSVEPDTELAALVREHDMGVVVPVGDADGMRTALRVLAADPQRVAALGRNARSFHERTFDAERIHRDWVKVLGDSSSASAGA